MQVNIELTVYVVPGFLVHVTVEESLIFPYMYNMYQLRSD